MKTIAPVMTLPARARRGFSLLGTLGILLLAGCSSGGDIEETTYQDGIPTDSAIVQSTPNGGYRTVAGDPVEVVDGDMEQESMMPYGGGGEGIRQMEDEATPFQNQF